MGATFNAARWFSAVARLRDNARRTADRVIARADAARRQGATAEAYRLSSVELERQATRAEKLLFSQTVKTFRAAAAESRLIADALDAITVYDGFPP